MREKKILLCAAIFLVLFRSSFSQDLPELSLKNNKTSTHFFLSDKTNSSHSVTYRNNFFLNQILQSHSLKNNLHKDKGSVQESTFPIAIGVASFLYLFNPIILFENDKIALGVTKEVSLGFGYFGQHRFMFEYSYIFRKDLSSHIRLGYNYDILLKDSLQPSNMLQGTPTLTFGGGYFNNFSRPGAFVQMMYGYSIRNDKFLFYPGLKLRYTYVEKGSDIIDFSFGILIGIANPFIDLKIRRTY